MRNTYLFLLLLALVACQGKKTKENLGFDSHIIPVAKGVANVVDELLLSKAADSIEVIALETNEKSIFNHTKIRNIVVCTDYIVVSTMTRVMCFDRAGNYIRDIGQRGQGNSDYIHCSGIGVDEAKRMVYVASGLNYQNELKMYTFEGEYKGAMRIAKQGVQMHSSSDHREERSYSYVDGKHLFRRMLPIHDGNNDIWQIEYQDTLGKVLDKIYDPACTSHKERMIRRDQGLDANEIRYVWSARSPMMNFYCNETNVLFETNDTVYSYSLKDKALKCRYILDTNRNPELTFEALRVMSKSDAFFKEIIAKEIYESKDYLYISVEKDDYSYLIEWNKNNGSICSIRNKGEVKESKVMGLKIRKTLESGWTNDLCGGPLFYQDHHNRTQWIGVYDAEALLELDMQELKTREVLCPYQRDKLVEIIENMKEDDNPVIVIATLK